jgi:uroporphyrinogen decarboxylase
VPGKLNPRERWNLLLIDELPDRAPVYPLVTSHAAAVYGCNLIEYCTDGKVLAEAQLAALRKYGHDGLSVFTDVGIIAEAMGSRYRLRDFEVPILDQPLISNVAQIESLQIPDPASDGRLPVYLESIEYMYRKVGDTLPIFAFIPCPFTTAAGLRGIDNFLMDTILNPQEARQLLEVSLQAAIKLCDECILAGALPVLVDPLASGSVISRRTFEEFALPYQERLILYLHRFDLDITLHICGQTGDRLDLVLQTGADLFSFDQTDFSQAMQVMAHQVRLIGNLPPNELLPTGKLSMEKAARELMQRGIESPKGFVLSTGCEVPIRCDSEKLICFIETGKKVRYESNW